MATGLTPTAVLRHIKKQIGAIPYEPELNDEDITVYALKKDLGMDNPIDNEHFKDS